MIKIKVEPEPVDECEIRYRDVKDEDADDDNRPYYQLGTIRDQVQSIWDEDIKPKIEHIDIEPNDKELNMKFEKDLQRKKWNERVKSTFHRHRSEKACQLCRKIHKFDSATKLIEHYKEFHGKKITSYNCKLCKFSGKQEQDILDHLKIEHCHHKSNKNIRLEKKQTLQRIYGLVMMNSCTQYIQLT